MAKVTLEDKKVKTIEFRVSHPHLDTPTEFKGDGKKKYRLTMLINKAADLSKMKKAIFKAKEEEFGSDQTKWPKMKPWLRDGDREKPGDPAYKGMYFVNATAKPDKQPQTVDYSPDRKPEKIDPKEIYAGCYARATLIAFVFDAAQKGVSFALLNVQKTRDGKKLGGGCDARDEFADGEEFEVTPVDDSEEIEVEASDDDLGF